MENTKNTNTLIEQTNNNQVKEPPISNGTLERDSLEQQNNLGSPIREGSPPISEVVPYPIDIKETPRHIQATLSTPIVGLQSLEFMNFRDFDHVNRTLRTFPIDQMATVNASESIPPIVTPTTTMVGTTAAASQPVPSTSRVNLPNCLIPTPMVPMSTSSALIPLGGMTHPPLYMQSISNPFSYGMPLVTMGSSGNFFANMVPSLPMSSRNTSNNFGPFLFGNTHILLSNPSLGGAFAAQLEAQVENIPMSRGGFIPQPYTQYRSNVGIGPSFIPQSSNPFRNSSPLTGGKMFGRNPYYSSSQTT